MNLNEIMEQIEKLSIDRDTLLAEKQKKILEREVNKLKMEVGGSKNLKEAAGDDRYDAIANFFGWDGMAGSKSK